jgi:hypothetical protein
MTSFDVVCGVSVGSGDELGVGDAEGGADGSMLGAGAKDIISLVGAGAGGSGSLSGASASENAAISAGASNSENTVTVTG